MLSHGGGALEQRELVADRTILSTDKLPLEGSRVEDSELAEPVVRCVEENGDVQNRVTVELAVAFNVASHTVDDVGHRLARIGVKGVVVDDGRRVDGVVAHRVETLIPVDVTEIGSKKLRSQQLSREAYPEK